MKPVKFLRFHLQRTLLKLNLPMICILAGCNSSIDELGLYKSVSNLNSAMEHSTPQENEIKTNFDDLELSFALLKSEILEKKCMKCHTAEKAEETVMDSLADIIDANLIGETPEESLLYKVVVPGLTKKIMPPKKSNIPPLSPDEVDYLRRWITAGAPE